MECINGDVMYDLMSFDLRSNFDIYGWSDYLKLSQVSVWVPCKKLIKKSHWSVGHFENSSWSIKIDYWSVLVACIGEMSSEIVVKRA